MYYLHRPLYIDCPVFLLLLIREIHPLHWPTPGSGTLFKTSFLLELLLNCNFESFICYAHMLSVIALYGIMTLAYDLLYAPSRVDTLFLRLCRYHMLLFFPVICIRGASYDQKPKLHNICSKNVVDSMTDFSAQLNVILASVT